MVKCRKETIERAAVPSNHSTAETPVVLLEEKERNGMAQNKTHHTDQQLHSGQLPSQPAFVQWASSHEPEVDDGHVGALHK